MKDPTWWTAQQSSAWERLREALKRDWEQTKADLSRQHGGHELNQQIGDTVKQATGAEVIPPPDVPNHAWTSFEKVAPAYRYGVGAADRYASDKPWDSVVEIELSDDWFTMDPPMPWQESKELIRHGWDKARAAQVDQQAAHKERKSQSGKIGWALLWLLGIPLPVLLAFYLIRGH